MSSLEIVTSQPSYKNVPDSSFNPHAHEWEPGELEAFYMQHTSDMEKMRNLDHPPLVCTTSPTQGKSLDNNQPNEDQVVKTKRVYRACCLIC